MAITPVWATTANAVDSALKVSQTLPTEADDPLRRWFAEQDKLLDDILVRLSRIESLVREIHQLVAQLPAGTSPVTAPPTTLPKPGVQFSPPKPASPGIFGFLGEWGSILAGIGLLLLVLMIVRRHRKTTTTKKPAEVVAATPAKTAPAEMKQPHAHSNIQRAGAMEPSKGQADQALELADIMLSMGLGHGAAQTLTEQIRNEPKQALRHWLKLLAIYRQNGQQAEFETSAEELRQHFNVRPEDWQVGPDSRHSIEDYPHIATRLCELWDRPACLVYLQNLLADNRSGARSGFPQSVAEEFLLLTSMLKARDI